jgi:hypothetical protein
MPKHTHRGLPRREFVKAAVAIGGASALAACADREGVNSETQSSGFPTGTDPQSLPDSQHAWSDYLVTDRFGNTVIPQHQLILLLEYVGSTPPTEAEREAVSTALGSIETAVQWGTGQTSDSTQNEGLLFTLGYAPSYFEQVNSSLPESIDLPPATDLIERLEEDADPDGGDAALVVASDYGSLVLAAEAALFGDRDHINGMSVDATLEGVFKPRTRRTGFIGRGLPAERLDHDEIPENAPLSMGYKSGFHDNIPPENKATIQNGPFADGATQLVSRLELDIDAWYDRDQDQRVSLMFSPHHDPEEVGKAGVNLAQDSGVTQDMTEDLDAEAREHGCLGHTQKAASARDDEFDPVILRRSESVATDTDPVEFNFTSVQRGIEQFARTREAMNRTEENNVPEACHGILDFMEVHTRGTYLLPPRRRRALPVPGRDGADA